jgi:hypothetical protein
VLGLVKEDSVYDFDMPGRSSSGLYRGRRSRGRDVLEQTDADPASGEEVAPLCRLFLEPPNNGSRS